MEHMSKYSAWLRLDECLCARSHQNVDGCLHMSTNMYDGGQDHGTSSVELLCSNGTAESVADPKGLTFKEE